MKRLIALLSVLTLLACVGGAALAEEAAPLRVVALSGPTAMGMVQMMNEAEEGSLKDRNWQFSIEAAPDAVTPLIAQGKVDIAAVPANLAAVLYQRTEGAIQALAVNTLGVLYIVENGETVQNVADLKGRMIYTSGKGSTPEYALNYILTGNGLDLDRDVTIEWKSEHAEALAALVNDENGVAMLPQPFATAAMAQNASIRVALDLTQEWEALQEGVEAPSAMITGSVIVRRAYAEEHPEEVAAFLTAYRQSVDYVNTEVAEAAQLVEKYGIVKAAIAQKAIPACNIVLITGEELQQKLSGYLAELYRQNPAAVGGQMPDDAFYYHN
ncbi:MAG: ABC transporter substrate-binding protein [Clostridia bacterium]|nr:ABC transporter substrate-binding protein [Clostridia bacterium]